MVKDEISGSYMDQQKEKHAGKTFRDNREFLVTGVSSGNIGKVTNTGLHSADLTKPTEVNRLINGNNTCDTLVLCHGYVSLDWIENQPGAEIEKVISTVLTSQVDLIAQFAHTTMNDDHKKMIIVIGSMAGQAVLNGSAPYCAAKAGLQHFVKCAAWELAPKGFDVFIINPGNVLDTPMSEKTIEELSKYRNMTLEQAREYWSANNPRKSFLSKDEIAEMVHYIAQGGSRYLSGSPINMSGGQR